MIETIKNFPPIRRMRARRYERLFKSASNKNLFRGIYEDYARAVAATPPTKRQGYDNDESAALYEDRRHRIFATDYPALFWLQRFIGDVRSVLDFGGHRGVSYFSYKRLLPFTNLAEWIVYDVPAVVAAGKLLAEREKETRLSFSTNPALAREVDLFFASGSLQYVDTPLHIATGDGRPKHVLINMLPVGDRGNFYTIQNIGTAFCPYHIYDARLVRQTFVDLGYEEIDSWENEGKICHIPFEANAGVKYFGFYFRKA